MKFVIQKSELSIVLEGREQFWALKNKIVVRRRDINSIRYVEEFRAWRKWELRLPGTGLPGVLVAGSFWTEQGWDFLYLVNPKGITNPIAFDVIVIETKLSKYRRIIVNCSAEQAAEVIAWSGK